jgi:manganese transport protein
LKPTKLFSKTTQVASWVVALIIVSLNAKLVFNEIHDWLQTTSHPLLLWLTVVPLAVFFLGLLLYIMLQPFFVRHKQTIDSH